MNYFLLNKLYIQFESGKWFINFFLYSLFQNTPLGDRGMYSSLQLAFKYINYCIGSSNRKGHGIHSPFVFDFIKNVLNDKKEYADYQNVESIRKELLKNRFVLNIEDYGAGSSSSGSDQRSIASIAKHAVKPKKYSQLLYRIVKYYKPNTIIELGTSLGLTASYLLLANPDANIFTFEGSAEIANKARRIFKTLEIEKIKLVEGNFDYTLPTVLYNLSSVDFAFIDGNHRREPTENYFQWLLPKANNNSIFIFDDIHWSKEMEQAWDNITEHSSVRCSIDLFFIGIILFRQEFKEKQHFTIQF